MNPPVRFLNSLAHAFSTMALYGDGHPARERSLDEVWSALQGLLELDSHPVFSFLDEDVVYGEQPLKDLRNWTLARHLAKNEIQRVEIIEGVTRDEFYRFLMEVAIQLGSVPGDPSSGLIDLPNINYGLLSVDEGETESQTPFDLEAEAQKVDWLQEEALIKGKISSVLASAVVQTLSVAMRYGRKLLVPLVSLKEADQYSTVHSMNTSVLAMALGEFLRLDGNDVRIIGEAALLHDMGKVIIPKEILNKPGKLDSEEWEIVHQHPVEGARILLRSEGELQLAAVAAYEHHIKWNGEGYPDLHYKRKPHPLAQLVHICDAYDAMRTKRPFQGPMPPDQILVTIESMVGDEFNPELVQAFATMMRQWHARVAKVEEGVVT